MKVLFVCRSNAGRSKAAEMFFKASTKRHQASSAGIDVEKEGKVGAPLGDLIVQVMKDGLAIDMSSERRKQVTPQMLKEADRVVVLLEKKEREEYMPKYFNDFKDKLVFWEITDMRDIRDIEVIKKRQEALKKRVEEFEKELDRK